MSAGFSGGAAISRQFAQRRVKIDETGTGQDALRRNMIEPPTQHVEHGAFPRVGRRHRDMAALALDGNAAARGRQQTADAKAAAGSDDADRRAGDRRARADLPAIAVAEPRNGQRVGGEIIDDVEALSPSRWHSAAMENDQG